MLNSSSHDVEFPDRQAKEHLVNVIDENMLSRVSNGGFPITIIEAITDYTKSDSEADMTDKHAITPKGRKRLR